MGRRDRATNGHTPPPKGSARARASAASTPNALVTHGKHTAGNPVPPPTDAATAAAAASPIQDIRRRTGLAGERGQVRSGWDAFRDRVLAYIGQPNPNKLRVEDYRKMETDAQVRAGYLIRENAILSKPPIFNYAPVDPDDPEEVERGQAMCRFLTAVWNRIQPDPQTVLRHILSARRFGFAVLEKVWASSIGPDGEPVLKPFDHPEFRGYAYVERLKLLPPESIESSGISISPYGHIQAVRQSYAPSAHRGTTVGGVPVNTGSGSSGAPYGIAWTSEEEVRLRLLIYRANYEPPYEYGISDHLSAYNPWFSKAAAYHARNVLNERLGGVVVGEYEDPNFQQAVETALDNLVVGATLTVPKGTDVRILAGWEGALDGFHESIRYDDIQILRAYLVPNETVGGDARDTGSNARANSHFDSFMLSLARIRVELEEVIEEQLIKPHIDLNWGPQAHYPTFDFPELEEKDRAAVAAVWSAAIRDGYVDPAVDAAWLREDLDVPEDAPAGHVFSRPQAAQPGGMPSATGVPGAVAGPYPQREAALPQIRDAVATAAARAPPPPATTEPVVFEGVDTPQTNSLNVESFEAQARSALADVLLQIQDKLLQNVPQDASRDELRKITVPTVPIERALDELARTMLDRARRDLARKFRALGRDDVADRLTADLPLKLTAKRAQVAAADGDDPLRLLQSYLAWTQALNGALAERTATELQTRLRERVLRAFAAGVSVQDAGRVLAEEFASYTTRQLDSVARTTAMDYFNSARRASYEAAGDYVRGVKFVPLLDTATTPFCRDLAGRSISKQDPLFAVMTRPPFNHNCRTTIVPVLATDTTHQFDTDWPAWFDNHRGVEGGAFLYVGS